MGGSKQNTTQSARDLKDKKLGGKRPPQEENYESSEGEHEVKRHKTLDGEACSPSPSPSPAPATAVASTPKDQNGTANTAVPQKAPLKAKPKIVSASGPTDNANDKFYWRNAITDEVLKDLRLTVAGSSSFADSKLKVAVGTSKFPLLIRTEPIYVMSSVLHGLGGFPDKNASQKQDESRSFYLKAELNTFDADLLKKEENLPQQQMEMRAAYKKLLIRILTLMYEAPDVCTATKKAMANRARNNNLTPEQLFSDFIYGASLSFTCNKNAEDLFEKPDPKMQSMTEEEKDASRNDRMTFSQKAFWLKSSNTLDNRSKPLQKPKLKQGETLDETTGDFWKRHDELTSKGYVFSNPYIFSKGKELYSEKDPLARHVLPKDTVCVLHGIRPYSLTSGQYGIKFDLKKTYIVKKGARENNYDFEDECDEGSANAPQTADTAATTTADAAGAQPAAAAAPQPAATVVAKA